jgi:molybdopterin-containing oxidoreductase family iron-sulfur binding subunit
MVFGDINDENALIVEKTKGNRMYHLLAEVGTKPNVRYQVKVRNTQEV